MLTGQKAGYFFQPLGNLERLGIMAFKWASSAIYRRDGFLLFLDLAAEQRIGSPLLLSFDCVRDGDCLGIRDTQATPASPLHGLRRNDARGLAAMKRTALTACRCHRNGCWR